MRCKSPYAWFLASVYLITFPVSAQEIFDYSPPGASVQVRPAYPRKAAESRQEGYVVFNFMIAPDGSMYDPVVVESTDSVFEASALKALESSEFTPATLNGENVDASHFYKFSYQMENGTGVDESFMRTKRFFDKYIKAGDLERASEYQKKLAEKSTDNLYEMAWSNLAGFMLAQAKDQPYEEYKYLKRAMAYHMGDYSSLSFLSPEVEPLARTEMFRLQTELQLFAEASSTFRMMEQAGDEAVEVLRPIFDQINELRVNETGYAINSELNAQGIWSIGLHKRGFFIDQVEGDLAELKLHCSAQYKIFAYKEEAQYSIPNSWGNCQLIVVGDPGTSFRLAQVPHVTN